jgi:hypothetical protein
MKYVLMFLLAALPAQLVYADDHASGDTRAVIELTAADRLHLLGEMRMFLETTQTIIQALGSEDWAAVAKGARMAGPHAMHGAPATLRQALPAEFRQQGMATHQDFERIALDAEDLKDTQHTLGQFSQTLNRCIACHATWQVREVAAASKPAEPPRQPGRPY